MAVVTECAKKELKLILSWFASGNPEIGLRIAPTEHEHFKVVLDTEKDGDQSD